MNEEYRIALEAMRADSAPARLEQEVLAAFRRRRMMRRAALWSLAAAAAIVFVAAASWKPAEIGSPAPLLAHIAAPPLTLVKAPPARPVRLRRRSKGPAQEIATRYYPLPGAEALPSPDAEAVVRMMVPQSALQLVGFPLTEQPRPEFVRADVVFGQDGMARAIRFVQ